MNVVRRLSAVGGGGASVDGIAFALAGATAVDTSNILGSATESAGEITITLDADTISNTPLTAWYAERPIVDVFGAAIVVDLIDLFRCVLRLGVLVPLTDMHVGMAIVSDDERGIAWRLAAVAGDWQAQHATSTAGTWSAWTASTSDADTQAMMGVLAGRGSGTTQARYNTLALDSVGTDQSGTTSTITTTASNVGNDLTKVRLFAGLIAGGLGVPGPITLKAAYLAARVLDFPALTALFL